MTIILFSDMSTYSKLNTRCILLFRYFRWYLSLLKVVSVIFMRILFTRDYPARETTFFRSQKL